MLEVQGWHNYSAFFLGAEGRQDRISQQASAEGVLEGASSFVKHTAPEHCTISWGYGDEQICKTVMCCDILCNSLCFCWHNRHLISIIGAATLQVVAPHCLVFELMSNGTVREQLDGTRDTMPHEWACRCYAPTRIMALSTTVLFLK